MEAQAVDLNNIIEKNSKTIYNLLSKKGKEIYFPKKGILAQTAEAKGKKINATIGEAVEDDRTPMRLKVIEKEIFIAPEAAFPYAPSTGKPEIRNKWKVMLAEKNPPLKNEKYSLPLVTGGLTHGLSILGYLFINENDKIILPDFYWENYNLIYQNWHGAILETFPLFKGNEMDTASLKNKLSEGGIGKKVLLMTFPNNPTGYTPTEKEMTEITSILKDSAEKGNQILVIIDDSYFGLVYNEGVAKYSLFSYLFNLHENILAVKVDGSTKEDYVWGFRVGFITYGMRGSSDELLGALEMKTAGAIRGNVSNVSHLSQSLLLKAFESKEYQEEKKSKYQILRSRYETVVQVLKDHPEYSEVYQALPFNSGYFMCIKLETGIDGEAIRRILLDEYNTGIIAFGNVLRVAFSSVDKLLIPELFQNIYLAGKKIRK